MKAQEIPQELLDILDHHAGKVHSRDGKVVAALAEILTHYGRTATEVGDYAALAVELDSYVRRLRVIFTALRERKEAYSAIYIRDAYQELEATVSVFRGHAAADAVKAASMKEGGVHE